MKRLLLAIALLLLPAQAFASTCNVTEFRLYAPSGVQVADLDSLVADQAPITTSGTSAQSAAFNGDTQMIQISCDTQSAMAYGANPTATTSNMTIPAGAFIYFKVTAAKKVAFILRP
jgi:predicted secreted Zn-dependent protease